MYFSSHRRYGDLSLFPWNKMQSPFLPRETASLYRVGGRIPGFIPRTNPGISNTPSSQIISNRNANNRLGVSNVGSGLNDVNSLGRNKNISQSNTRDLSTNQTIPPNRFLNSVNASQYPINFISVNNTYTNNQTVNYAQKNLSGNPLLKKELISNPKLSDEVDFKIKRKKNSKNLNKKANVLDFSVKEDNRFYISKNISKFLYLIFYTNETSIIKFDFLYNKMDIKFF